MVRAIYQQLQPANAKSISKESKKDPTILTEIRYVQQGCLVLFPKVTFSNLQAMCSCRPFLFSKVNKQLKDQIFVSNIKIKIFDYFNEIIVKNFNEIMCSMSYFNSCETC